MNVQTKTEGAYSEILVEDRQEALYRAILQCKTTQECSALLTDLCTPQELQAISERWMLARLLDQGGLSYRDISELTGASTTTVGRVARFLQQEPHKGYELILERVNNNESPNKKNKSS